MYHSHAHKSQVLTTSPHTHTQVQVFIDLISGSSSLYGLKVETLDSLVLSLLPSPTHTYESIKEPRVMDSSIEHFREPNVMEEPLNMMDDGLDLKVLLMKELLQNLRHCAGFHIPPVSITNLMAPFSSR